MLNVCTVTGYSFLFFFILPPPFFNFSDSPPPGKVIKSYYLKLAVCLQPFVEASVWMIIWGLAAEVCSHCKVSSFLSSWLNSPVSHDHCRTFFFSVELIFAPAEDTTTGFVLAKWPGQLMTTSQLTLWDKRLKFLVPLKSDIFETRFNFFCERAKVIFFVSISKLRNSYLFHRVKDWFFEVDHKTHML